MRKAGSATEGDFLDSTGKPQSLSNRGIIIFCLLLFSPKNTKTENDKWPNNIIES